MSDLTGLHGVYPTSIRWNAEDGFLSISVFNPESGERELQEIELGPKATFVMDLQTRKRGYGLIRVGVYDMRLTPVGSTPPIWPGDDEFKPAIGCWLWNPTYSELRLETCGAMFRQAIVDIWDEVKFKPKVAEGLEPVINFAGTILVPVKSVGKTFHRPKTQIIGWVPRNEVPGWSERPPTVLPPKPAPALPASPVPVQAMPAIEEPAKGKSKAKVKRAATKLGPDDGLERLLGDDPIPFS